MPFTPFHFGLHATVGLPLRKYIDLPVFVLASVAVDLEPLAVMVFGLNYPLHGYCHTFLFGALVGLAWGLLAYWGRGGMAWAMRASGLNYEPSIRRALLSGLLGVWLHILFDAPIYADIRPFYPYSSNPLYGLITDTTAYRIGAAAFIPALILFLIGRRKRGHSI